MKLKILRKKIIVFLCIIVLIVAGLCVLLNRQNKKSDYIIRAGNEVGNIILVDSLGEEVVADEIFNKTSFVFYISDHCSPCLEKLSSIYLFCSLLCDQNRYNYAVIWRDRVPDLAQYDESKNYFIRDFEISTTTPMFYVVENAKVVFATQDFNKFINKAVNMAKADFFKNLFQSKYNPTGDKLFVFLNDEYDYAASLSDMDKLVFIVSDEQLVREGCEDIYDSQGILGKLYGVEYYPTVLGNNSKLYNIEYAVNNLF